MEPTTLAKNRTVPFYIRPVSMEPTTWAKNRTVPFYILLHLLNAVRFSFAI